MYLLCHVQPDCCMKTNPLCINDQYCCMLTCFYRRNIKGKTAAGNLTKVPFTLIYCDTLIKLCAVICTNECAVWWTKSLINIHSVIFLGNTITDFHSIENMRMEKPFKKECIWTDITSRLQCKICGLLAFSSAL